MDQTPLNPVQVEQEIHFLANEIARGIPIVSDAEKHMVDAKRHLDREIAQATLEAKGTVMDRQAQVELATQAAREEYDIAYIAYRHAERTAKSLDSRLRAIQSIGASVRSMYSVGGRGEGA